MNILKFIGLAIVQLLKEAGSLLQAVAALFSRRGGSAASEADDLEAERLDRLRHPSKYRGR